MARVTEAIYDAGYNSNGRFYETSNQVLGMTPIAAIAPAAPTPTSASRSANARSAAILVAQSERGVCAILLGDDPDALVRDLQDRFPQREPDRRRSRRSSSWWPGWSASSKRPALGLDLPLDVRGTAFQQRVWQALREDSGRRHGELHARSPSASARPNAVRAVAQACAANTLAVAIPCHRVVRNDGALSGYRWGVERKRALLEREAQA